MRAYKVLGRYEGKLISLCYLNHHTFGIVYEEGKSNTAEFPLFVFGELDKARLFMDTHFLFPIGAIEIWLVEAINLRPQNKVCMATYKENVRTFWTSRNKEELEIAYDAPDGTMICDYLTLIERVE